MPLLNRPILASKEEYQPGDFKGLTVRELPDAAPNTVFLVSCPARSYQAVSITDCKECPFWYGFAPQKQRTEKEKRESAMISLCGFPVGRAITKIKV